MSTVVTKLKGTLSAECSVLAEKSLFRLLRQQGGTKKYDQVHFCSCGNPLSAAKLHMAGHRCRTATSTSKAPGFLMVALSIATSWQTTFFRFNPPWGSYSEKVLSNHIQRSMISNSNPVAEVKICKEFRPRDFPFGETTYMKHRKA